ncbi:MAG TPA: hypothetical protein VK178_14655 [Opitutaceae bacterium]|nr:hypothetical protein [Opitutaceae bacterium]
MQHSQQKVTAAARSQPWWSFPISIHQEADGMHVQIAWKRLGLLLLATAVAAWLVMGGVVFLWVKYWRGFSEARIVDILLPNRWAGYRVARGDFYVRQAKQEFAQQRWAEAIHHLRVGVAASPSNTEGRLILAHFFTIAGRIELAQRTLVEGVPYAADNFEFLKTLFGFLLQYQEDDEVRRVAAQLLPATPVLSERNQLIALAAASANAYRCDYDAAEKLIADYQLARTKAMDGRLLSVRIEWERGHHTLALERLKGYLAEYPGEDEFYNQLTSYSRELGREAAVEQFALLRSIANPRSTAARIDLLRSCRRAADRTKYDREIESFCRDFDADHTALLLLGNFATENGDAPLALRVYRHLKQRELESDAAGLMVAEAHLVARDYRAALDFIIELGRARPEWMQKFLGIVNGLQAVASYGLDQREEGDLYLSHFLGQPNLRAEHLSAIANRLIAIGAKPQARRVLAQAVALNPRNQPALALLIELDLERAPSPELVANLHQLLTMRRPPIDLLQKTRARLSSDRFLFVAGRDELLTAVQAALGRGPAPVPKDS